MGIVFEEMKEAYLKDILQIYNYYVRTSTATFQIREITLNEMREIVFFSTDRYKAYVVKASGEICGYVILTQFKKREAYDKTAEVTVYLKPGFTGKGIGGKAVSFIEKHAADQQIHVLVACISGENTDSIRLFESQGYEKCAHFKEVGAKFGRLVDMVYYQKII